MHQYLAGKFMGDLMQAEQQATMDTFNQNGFAFREINLPKIDEFFIRPNYDVKHNRDSRSLLFSRS